MFIITGQRCDQRGGRFGQAVTQRCVFGDQNLGHTVDLGGGVACGSSRGARAQNGHIAQGLGRGHGLGGCVDCQFTIGDFCEKKNSHYTAPASLSFATSSSTEPTMIPAARATGSEVLTISRRGVTSTP